VWVYFVVPLFYRRFPVPSLTGSEQSPRNHSSKSYWCVCGSLPSPEDLAYGNEACANDEIIKSSLQAPIFRKHWNRLHRQWTATPPAASLKTSHVLLNSWLNIYAFLYSDPWDLRKIMYGPPVGQQTWVWRNKNYPILHWHVAHRTVPNTGIYESSAPLLRF